MESNSKTFLYSRVACEGQDINHQASLALREGQHFDAVYSDDGVSGYSTPFKDRPGALQMLSELREGDTVLVTSALRAWLDRLGRGYPA